MDPKSELNQFLQKLLKRMTTKADTAYVINHVQDQSATGYQAIVTLKDEPLPGMGTQYAGDVCGGKKDAEKSAAAAALQALRAANPEVIFEKKIGQAKRDAAQALGVQVQQNPAKRAKKVDSGLMLATGIQRATAGQSLKPPEPGAEETSALSAEALSLAEEQSLRAEREEWLRVKQQAIDNDDFEAAAQARDYLMEVERQLQGLTSAPTEAAGADVASVRRAFLKADDLGEPDEADEASNAGAWNFAEMEWPFFQAEDQQSMKEEFQKTFELFMEKAGAAGLDNPRCMLNQHLGRMLGRPLKKDDVVIEVQPGPGVGWHAILTHTEIPNFNGPSVHQGPPCRKKKDAEQGAAAVAVLALQAFSGTVFNFKQAKQARTRSASAPPATAESRAAKALKPNSPHSEEFVAEYEKMRETRAELVPAEEISNLSAEAAQSGDMWFGMVCLSCLRVVPHKALPGHLAGRNHQQKFLSQPWCLKAGQVRIDTAPCQPLQPKDTFIKLGGWAELGESGSAPPVLTLGEMDYSFSLALAKLRPKDSPVVCTSYLEEHDPTESEVHPADDNERATYSRRTLPGMKGMLQDNINALKDHGAEIRHGVDATNLAGTLRTQGVDGGFQYIVFPFPRASLSRAPDPRNSRLLRLFFESVANDGFLMEGGIVQLVMLCAQFEEWDVAGMAASMGFRLISRASLPDNFYQAREMSGKPWTPPPAQLLCFSCWPESA